MKKIKKGDVVTRNSYGNDIVFVVKNIIKLSEKRTIATLKGIDVRIEADAPIEDLQIASKDIIDRCEKRLNQRIKEKLAEEKEGEDDRVREVIMNGKILHLDGDKRYSEKSQMYYNKMGLKAVVKNIPENKQPRVVYRLLQIYNPDILVITRS